MIGLARDRAQDFRDNWFFSCECQRCQDSTDLGWQSSSWLCESCGDPAPPSSPPQWGGVQCPKCGWEVEEEEVVKMETLLALKVQEGPEDGADGVREWAEDLLAQEDVGRLHPHHALAMIVKMRLMRTPALGLPQMRRKVEVPIVLRKESKKGMEGKNLTFAIMRQTPHPLNGKCHVFFLIFWTPSLNCTTM